MATTLTASVKKPLRQNKSQSAFSFRIFAIAGVTLLALALGGSTELWAQGIVIVLAALVIAIFPPRRSIGSIPPFVLFLFFLLACTAFMPMMFGPMPEWRRHLELDLHAPMGALRTPQPWLTLQACGLLGFGLIWIYYLFAQEWSPAERLGALQMFLIGVMGLTVVATLSFLTQYRIPGWTQEQNRGWFPNRNQTADVLAVAGILTYTIAFRRLQNREWTGLGWLAGLAVLCAGLVISYSRAGILMFFAGLGIWHVLGLVQSRRGNSAAMGLVCLLLLLSLFLLFGGSSVERFMHAPTVDHRYAADYRVLIQEDAFNLSLRAPFLGTGLANFGPVFTSTRQFSADQNQALHPESDWLWMVVEMGWGAPLIVLFGICWWVRRSLPFLPKSGEALRRAAMVASVMYILHGLVDVSSHRLGSFMAGMLIASLALSPAWPRKDWAPLAYILRGLALLLALLGFWWLASGVDDDAPPTTATLDRALDRMNQAAKEGRIASVSDAANAALVISPLEWSAYFRRASAEALRNGGAGRARADFLAARFLQPKWVDICLNEGSVWLVAGQVDACIDAWREALHRAGSDGDSAFSTMLGLAKDNPSVRLGLRDIASSNPNYLTLFLETSTQDEAKSVLQDLLIRDPELQTLSFDQQKALFTAWWDRGDRDDLATQLAQHTDWQAAGWKALVFHYADAQNYELASLTTLRYLNPPIIQKIPVDESLEKLERRFEEQSSNVVEGLKLFQAQLDSDQAGPALATVISLERLKDCPRYVFYLHGQLAVKKKSWEEAWNAFKNYNSW